MLRAAGAGGTSSSSVTGITNGGTWDSATTYAVGAVVRYGTASYIAVAASTGTAPGSDATKWAFIAADGTNGAAGTPGQSYGAQLLSGGGVARVGTTGYNYTVSAASYVINGTVYSSAQTDITLTAADGSLDRIDVFVLTTSSTAIKVDGTAATNPAEPSLDPLTQLKVGFVLVGAGTTNATIASTTIYAEDIEWTSSVSGAPMNKASTSNPHGGTKDIEATAAVAGNYVNLANGSAFDTTTRNTLVFYMRSKAAWPSAKSVLIQWYNSTTAVGTAVTLKTGAYGFNSGTLAVYQQVVIPLSAFGVSGVTVTDIRFTVTGGGSTLGFYLDDILMQGGITQTSPTASMSWRGTYSASVQYLLNDVVFHHGGLYIANQSLLAIAPTATGWTALNAINTFAAAHHCLTYYGAF